MSTSPNSTPDDLKKALFNDLLQISRHLYSPSILSLRYSVSQNESGDSTERKENDDLLLLQKRVKEMDFTLEHIQKGTMISTITLHTHEGLAQAAKLTTSEILSNHLDKYNASQVDQLFVSLDIDKVAGDTDEAKVAYETGCKEIVRQWPLEIAQQTRALNFPFAGTIEKEVRA